MDITLVILGFDPGLASTGYGAIVCDSSAPSLLRCGYIKTFAGNHVAERLYQIHNDATSLIQSVKPDLIAIENVFSLVRYPRAGIVLGNVLGVLYLSAFENKARFSEITPKEIKNALVGHGSADKKQIRLAVQKILKIGNIRSFHAADALGVALTAFYRKKYLG